MEKGIIKSYDKSCGLGTISRASDVDVRFYAASIIERDRSSSRGFSFFLKSIILKTSISQSI